MTFACILTPVADSPIVDAHLAAAAALARAYHAVLVGSAAELFLPAGLGMDMGGADLTGEFAVAERNAVEKELTAAVVRFEAATRGLELQATCRSHVDFPDKALLRRAVLADLVVVGRMPADDMGICRSISVADIVMHAGRPVLRVPVGGMAHEPHTVAVAWKNTREARRAVADALPFLHRAESVLIYAIAETGDLDMEKSGLADCVAFLKARHIEARAVTLPMTDMVGEDILSAAARAGADLIVSGAYGHSRAREWLFGGVTETLLRQQDTAVLFSR